MEEWLPSVSMRMPTYRRLLLLQQAVNDFLTQDYKGEKELVILNEEPETEIKCDHPEIKIYNCSEKPKDVRERYNMAMALCMNDIIFPCSDDDIHMPWEISTVVSLMQNEAAISIVPWWKIRHGSWRLMTKPTSYMIYMTREFWEEIGPTPSKLKPNLAEEFWRDQAIERKVYKIKEIPQEKIFFIWQKSKKVEFYGAAHDQKPQPKKFVLQT